MLRKLLVIVKYLQYVIFAGFPERPKNLRVLCQPHPGNKQGLMTYGSIVEPIFKNANTNIDFSGKIFY